MQSNSGISEPDDYSQERCGRFWTNKGTIRQLLETQPQAEEGRLDINNTHNEPGCYVFKFCFEYTPKLLHKLAMVISKENLTIEGGASACVL